MNPQPNPYEPPKSQIESDAFAPRRSKMKRPASHKWAIFFFFASSALTVRLLFGTLRTGVFNVRGAVLLVMCLLPLLMLTFFRYSRITYYITAVEVALIALLFGFMGFSSLLRSNGDESGGFLSANVFWIVVFVSLFWRFSFGRPSRAYFGFCEPPPSEVEAPEIRTGAIEGKQRPDGWDVNY